MQIENNKGVFNLIDNTPLSIEKTNPFTSEQGSASLPYKFIRTRHNQNLLEDTAQNKDYKTDVNIRSGVFNINASLDILSISEKEIEGVFLLDETSFYQVTKNTTLAEAMDKEVSETTDINWFIFCVNNLIFKEGFEGANLSDNFAAFPIAKNIKFDERTRTKTISATTAKQNIINEIYKLPNGKLKLRGADSYTYTDDDNAEITVPKGYGLTIFPRLQHLLDLIFQHFNLTLDISCVQQFVNFKNIVVLNNTQDAGLYNDGILKYSQLVPDCTIAEMLDAVRKMFCAEFIIDTNKNTATLVLLKDVLSTTPHTDLNQYLQARPTIEMQTPKAVSISVAKDTPNSQTDTDTWNEFYKKYEKIYFTSIDPLAKFGMVNDNRFNTINKFSDWKLTEGIDNIFKNEFVSSLNFDYKPTDKSLPLEEHKIPATFPVTINIFTEDQEKKATEFHAVIMPGFRNLNTHIVLDNESIQSTNDALPIIFAMELEGTTNTVGGISEKFTHEDYLSLRAEDFYNKFYKEYDYCLQNSWHTVKCKLRLPADMIQNFKFDNLYLINGQPVLPVSLKYEMKEERHIIADCEFRTVTAVNPWLSF